MAIRDEEEKSTAANICEYIKLVVSTLVVSALLLVIVIGVSLSWCVLQIHPAANFVLMFLCLTLLAYVEALHFACVSVEKWDINLYKDRFPRAAKCHALIDTPIKVKKFLVGRQFFVIFVVFLLAQITSFPGIPKNFLGMPHILVIILVQTGLPGIALTLNVGQLISQIYVEEFTLQFLNLYGCNFVIRLSLAAEFIGICHFSWLLYAIDSRIFCRKVRKAQKTIDESTSDEMIEAPMSPTEKIRGPNFDNGMKETTTLFDIARYCWSTVATIGAIIVVCYGISIRAYVLPVPPVAAFIIAGVTLTILFYLEGLMIALVGTQYWDREMFREVYPRAYKIHALMSKPENMKRFIIGRQFFTVLTNFLLAQIFTFANWDGAGYNPVIFFILVKSGLVGVMIILSFAQLQPELLAAEYPLRFMDMLGSYSISYFCLIFDYLAVGHFGWTIYYVSRYFCCGSNTAEHHTKPEIVKVNSAEVLSMTSSSKKSTRNPV
eukprot:gene4094-5842_t